MGIADPPAVIRWMRDGSPLLDGPGIQVSSDQRRVSVAAVTLADAGDYSCIATNDVASITQEFKVKVLSKCSARNGIQSHLSITTSLHLYMEMTT